MILVKCIFIIYTWGEHQITHYCNEMVLQNRHFISNPTYCKAPYKIIHIHITVTFYRLYELCSTVHAILQVVQLHFVDMGIYFTLKV